MSICKLQITYHNILKMNIGLSKFESTSATCAITNTQCCQSVIRNLVYKFVCRLEKSHNTIVKALLSSSIVYSSRVHVCPLEGAAFCSWRVVGPTLYDMTVSVVCSVMTLL